MNRFKKQLFSVVSLVLCLTLALAPSAQALTVEQARELLKTYYVDEIPDEVLALPTVDAIIDALGDPYTEYMSSEEYAEFLNYVNNAGVGGIGVSCSLTNGEITIGSVLSGSSAAAAGLQTGDVILAADGTTVATMSDVMNLIRGDVGTNVTLTIRHASGTTETYTLVRQALTLPTVTALLVDDDVCYLSCTSFGDNTSTEMSSLINEYDDSELWIVDLRGNTGGYAETASACAGFFLGSQLMVYYRDNTDSYSYTYTPSTFKQLTNAPAIILTSEYTASAAELFSAAMRDYGACLMVGDRTFGKGVAQIGLTESNYPDYFPDGGMLKVTTYRFYSPEGATNDKIGLFPHLLVSAENADLVAVLLTADNPNYQNINYAKLTLGGYDWYINLTTAKSGDYSAAFQELLEAIPPSAQLSVGQGNGKWSALDAAALAAKCGITRTSRCFTDVTNSAYADAINTLSTYDLLGGYPDGSFHPDNSITRAQLCSLLAGTLGISAKSTHSFSDVPATAWYASAVNAMYDMGFVSGCGNGQFRPNDIVTHEQLVSILASVGAWLDIDLYEDAKVLASDTSSYSDHVADFPDWCLSAANLCYASQLFWEDPVKIDAQASATRGETAQMLYQLLSVTDILPK